MLKMQCEDGKQGAAKPFLAMFLASGGFNLCLNGSQLKRVLVSETSQQEGILDWWCEQWLYSCRSFVSMLKPGDNFEKLEATAVHAFFDAGSIICN